jgi:hypothetical protein
MAAVNILNKQLCSANKGWSASLGLGEVLRTPRHKNFPSYRTLHKASDLEWSFGMKSTMEMGNVNQRSTVSWEDNTKTDLEEEWRRALTGFIWLRIRTGGRCLWMWCWTFWFHKMCQISWLYEDLLASHEELCSMEWVNELVMENFQTQKHMEIVFGICKRRKKNIVVCATKWQNIGKEHGEETEQCVWSARKANMENCVPNMCVQWQLIDFIVIWRKKTTLLR